MRQARSFWEAKEWLESRSFEYIGGANVLDCYTHYFVKPGSKPPLLAVVDGWWGDWTPHIRATDERELEAVRRRIAAERADSPSLPARS